MESKKKKKGMIKKEYIGIIVFFSSIIVLLILFGLFGIIKLENPFKKNELSIEKTEVLVDDIKIIAQLFTFSYYTEIVIDSTKETPGIFSNNIYQLVIVARGTSYIGTDLSELDTSKVQIIKNKNNLECILTVPSAKIFNTVVNPSGFSIFIDNKSFTPDEVQSTKNKAIAEIEKNAISSGVLEKANERTKKLFHDLLIGMGYSKVTVLIK